MLMAVEVQQVEGKIGEPLGAAIGDRLAECVEACDAAIIASVSRRNDSRNRGVRSWP